jgi:hypothetical protein
LDCDGVQDLPETRGFTGRARELFWGGVSFLLVVISSSPAYAHKPSDSYLTLQLKATQVSGQWDFALRDLEYAIGLDANEDGAITWGELRAARATITAYALDRLRLELDGAPTALRVTDLQVDHHTDGAYAVLGFETEAPHPPVSIEVDYRALFDIDPQHRGLLRLEAGARTHLAVFSPERCAQTFDLAGAAHRRHFLTFVREGVWHLWAGFDHLLFLIALLLPAVFGHEAGRWQAVLAFRPAFLNVLKIVTAFTAAHSLTLSLATMELVTLPSRLVESAIAASVILAAVNNVRRLVGERGWLVAFGFGLIHGFGFANALADLGLSQGTLALALVGFNAGVEAGQLAAVAAFLPAAFALRASGFYGRLTLPLGSLTILLLATTWLAERLFDFKWLPF